MSHGARPRAINKGERQTRLARRTAAANGLRYVSDVEPGIRRVRRGNTFGYVNARGRQITDAATLQRIRMLAIPPAYRRVWICADANGHLQATGYDARGRKQYRYHPGWRGTRDANKFSRMGEFGARLPMLRAHLQRDLSLPGLPREKVLALVTALLDKTLIRIGNAEYARHNHSYGLTTLRDHHVRFLGRSRARLAFRGKSGKDQIVELTDRRLTQILRRCQEVPGQLLFQYVDDAGEHQAVDSGMVNDYLLAVMGSAGDGTGFTAKDFRTWGATVRAMRLLADLPPASTQTAFKRCVVEVCKQVAAELGNTAAICRKAYINPWVFEAWHRGLRPRAAKSHAPPHAQEHYALQLLKLQSRP